MFISRKCLHSKPPPQLFVGDTVLTSVDTVKYLGVILSSEMSWSPHINKINAKTRRLIELFYRRFYFVHLHLSQFILLSFVLIWNMRLLSRILISAKTLTF